jgi:hypothetical protein
MEHRHINTKDNQWNVAVVHFDSWDYIVEICEEISAELGDRL